MTNAGFATTPDLPLLSSEGPDGPQSFSAAASASVVRPFEDSQRGLSGVMDSPTRVVRSAPDADS